MTIPRVTHEQIIRGVTLSIEGWVTHLEQIRRDGCPSHELDHLQATMCQAIDSLRALIAHSGNHSGTP